MGDSIPLVFLGKVMYLKLNEKFLFIFNDCNTMPPFAGKALR